MSFAKDSSGNWGYKIGGAGSVIPFSKNADFYSALPVGKQITVKCTQTNLTSPPYQEPPAYGEQSSDMIYQVLYNDGMVVYMMTPTAHGSFTNYPSTEAPFYKAEFTVNGKTYHCGTTLPSYEIEYYTTASVRKNYKACALNMFKGITRGIINSYNGDFYYKEKSYDTVNVYLAILI